MYPNQGFPGQYPPNNSGFPAQTPQAGFAMQQGFVQQSPMPSQYQAPQMPAYGQLPLQYPYQVPQIPYQQQFFQPANQLIPNAFPQVTPVDQQDAEKKQVKKGRPTVVPAPNFDASNDAAILRKAMKGFGTNEDALINVLCRRPCDQRIEISRAFKTAYGKDLIADIRSETSGNFEDLLVALLTPKVDFYCNELYCAMDGVGTDEDALIEVMCTMSNQEIRDINAMYQIKYKKTLEKDLRGDTGGYMKRLMISLSAGGRDESMKTDVNSARQDAESLKKAGVDKFGTDESEFIRILCLRNYDQLKLVCQEYERLTGSSLEKDIKDEFSGDIEDALLAIIHYANNRPEFFARRLHKSMVGLGTNDRSLIRLCVSRCEIDMEDIKDAFQRLYGKTLKSFIKGDTSGDYKNALFTLCGESR